MYKHSFQKTVSVNWVDTWFKNLNNNLQVKRNVRIIIPPPPSLNKLIAAITNCKLQHWKL